MKKNFIISIRTIVITLFMMFLSIDYGYGQFTGQNFSFELGSYDFWRGYQAQNNSNGSTMIFTPWTVFNNPATCQWQGADCFVINSNVNEFDSRIPTLKKIPNGYTKSTQINCAKNNKNVNMLTYDLDVTDQNCLLTFNFAIIMESPGHPGYESPFFRIEIVGLENGVETARVAECALFEVKGDVSTAPPGWNSFTGGIWQPWRQVSMNLTNNLGTTVRVKIILASCEWSGHYAYGYFVGRVSPSVLNVNACGNEGNAAVIEAPPGFQSYEWFANPEDLPEHLLGGVASTSVPLFTSTATATVPANNIFSLSTANYDFYGENYFVKVTSPSSTVGVPGCVAYMKTRVQTIKPITRYNVDIDCQLTATFDNITEFPFDDGGDKEFIWDFGDGQTATYINTDPTTEGNISPTHTYESAGTYIVKLSARYDSCINEIEREIIIPETPSFSLLDTTVCMGETIDISIQNPAITTGVTYTWTNPNDATPFIGQVYNGTFNESTEIIVEAVSPSCNYIDTVIVDVQEFPDITLTGDTMLCDGETVFITASDATGNTQEMQWSLTDPGTPPQFNPNQPVTSDPVFTYTPTGDMTIYLIARTGKGCMGSKSINIKITDPRVVANKYKVCPEDPVVLTGFDAVDYSWTANPPDPTLPAGRSANSVTAHPLETTVYTMRGYGESGCFAERTIKVTVIPYPEGEIYYSPDYVDVDNPVLSIKDVSKYGVTSRWDISDGTTSEQRSFSHKFNDVSGQSVEIRLTSYNEVGCSDTASVVVPIELFSVWVPNAFSPDGDGRNDRFFFKSLNKLGDVKFEVYNKWGERLYLFESPNFESFADMSEVHGWDGKFNGKDVQVGSYVWRLTYKRQGNERVYDKNGTINIIR
ncbi:MAG: PKD domain-containing protein [Bacteroidales bacterium]|nr:PKD domain-containing protein [Bacteroidales bacterium]MDD4685179.1 PKD domain-containing protein [Bacteroidales bacterium]